MDAEPFTVILVLNQYSLTPELLYTVLLFYIQFDQLGCFRQKIHSITSTGVSLVLVCVCACIYYVMRTTKDVSPIK